LDDLKRAMIEAARDLPPRDAAAGARLPIDRVFTMKGFGTVVTGTLVAGTIRREDELEVFPAGKRVRVRGVQVHGERAEAAVAGQRSALNLAGVSREDLSRGMTLVPPGRFETTRRADVLLRLLPAAARPLKNRARLRFHSYTMESVVEVVLHGEKQIEPGGEALARLRFPQAVLLLPTDRFILRQFSPVVTIGGGTVLDAAPLPRARELVSFLTSLRSGGAEEILQARTARRQHRGISKAGLVAETGWTRSSLEERLAPLLRKRALATFGEIVLHAPAVDALRSRILKSLADFHRESPLAGAIGQERLRGQVDASPEVFDGVAAGLAGENKIEIAGDQVRLPGRGVVMKDDEAESRKTIEDAFAAAGLRVPALHEVLAELKIDHIRAQKIVTLLLREKRLIKISPELVFHRDALEELRRQIAAYKKKSPAIDVAQFKEITGVSRKYAIPLLEYMDRERVTRRVGDRREIL
jgi:selenocysteine-specific elongation factor